MSFNKKTIRDIHLDGKQILLRADYNVPINDGHITDDYRIKQSLPTIEYLLDRHCSIVVCSHLGRPDGKRDEKYSLAPIAKRLSKLLDKPVQFADDCIGPEVEKQVKALEPGQLLLLENVRFHPEEEANDAGFAKQLATYGDIFVQDAFGVVHHGAVSVSELPKYMPGVSGLLLEKEVDAITSVMENPKRPLMAIIGGAKISDKIEFLERFIELADFVAIGGAMANTFLLAEGIHTGHSLTEPEDVKMAKHLLDKARAKAKSGHFTFYLPQDGVVAKKIDKTSHTRIVDWQAHVIADVEAYPKRPQREASTIQPDESVLDIGPFSGAFIAGGIQLANTVVWNGAMGVTETPALVGPIGPFAHGTELVIEAMTGQFGHRPYSLVGGGDTVGYIEARGEVKFFDHVSTGGGASLELMSGKKLPGVEALQNK